MRTSVKPENYFLDEQSNSLGISGYIPTAPAKNFSIKEREFNEFVSTTNDLKSISFFKITEIPEGLIFPDSVKKISISISESKLELPDSPPKCINLEELEISTCTFLKKLFPLSNFSNLKTLRINDCSNLETIPSLSNCQKLERVDISLCGNLQLNPESIKELQTFEKKGCTVTYPDHLKYLSINSSSQEGSTNSGITAQPTNEAGPRNSTLSTYTSRFLAGIAKILPLFKFMRAPVKPKNYILDKETNELRIIRYVNAKEFNSLVKTKELESIESINFSCIEKLPEGLIFPDSVKQFSITISEHEVFNLPKSPPICKNLETLRMTSCYNMEELFPLSSFLELKQLTINGSRLKTLPSLSNCKKLEKVDLAWCGNLQLTPESIKELKTLEKNGCSVTYPDHLKHLSINSSSQEGSTNSGITAQPTNEAGPRNSTTSTYINRFLAGIAKILPTNCITPTVDQDQTPGTGVTRAKAKGVVSNQDTTKNI